MRPCRPRVATGSAEWSPVNYISDNNIGRTKVSITSFERTTHSGGGHVDKDINENSISQKYSLLLSILGVVKSDRQELEAISNVFGREKAIKVGTVKSVVGYSETVSGICAILKVIYIKFSNMKTTSNFSWVMVIHLNYSCEILQSILL